MSNRRSTTAQLVRRTALRPLAVALVGAMLFPVLLAGWSPGAAADYVPSAASALYADWAMDADGNGLDDALDADVAQGLEGLVWAHVHYDRRPTAADANILELRHGVTRSYVFQNFDSIKVEVPYAQVASLLQAPGVVAVEKFVPPVIHMDASLKAIRVHEAVGVASTLDHSLAVHHDLGYRGEGMIIAILDTGVDNTHESLDDMDDDPLTDDPKLLQRRDANGVPVLAAADASDGFVVRGCVDPVDDNLHGTHVAGTALGTGGAQKRWPGVAPAARLVDVDIAIPRGDTAYGTGIDVGLDWIVSFNKGLTCYGDPGEDRIDVGSMSFGGSAASSVPTASMNLKTTAAAQNGITFVQSAGNNGEAASNLGAGGEGVILVANVDDRGTVGRGDDRLFGGSSGSARGPRAADGDGDTLDELRPDIGAPGTSITAPLMHSYNQYVGLTGTSMAAPHIAGVAALMLQANPSLRPVAHSDWRKMGDVGAVPIRDLMQLTAEYRAEAQGSPVQQTSVGKFGRTWNNGWGYGYVDAYAAVLLAESLRPQAITLPEAVVGTVGSQTAMAVSIEAPAPYDITIAWGDGEETILDAFASSSFTALHTYATTGTFAIDVTVVDAEAQTHTASTEATITDPSGGVLRITSPAEGASVTDLVRIEGVLEAGSNLPPVASFTHAATGLTVDVDASASSDPEDAPLAFTWDFGDGGSASGVTASHAYTTDGTYEVCLTVSDGARTGVLCQDVTVVSDNGLDTLATDPEGDTTTLTGADVDSLDIRRLEARTNDDGSFTFVMTLKTTVGHKAPPVGEGADGTIYRVEWVGPTGNTDFVQLLVGMAGQYCSAGSRVLGSNLYNSDADGECVATETTPGTMTLTFTQSAMAAKGYTAGETLLTAVRGVTLLWRGTPPDAPGVGSTPEVDTTDSSSYTVEATNADLVRLDLATRQQARAAPSAPPADPHVEDDGADALGDTVPHPAMDVEAAWFEADAENLYVGLKVADIPAARESTAFNAYSVNFFPSYPVADATWGGNVVDGGEFTGLTAFALYSPVRGCIGPCVPTSDSVPQLELQATSVDTDGRSYFGKVADVTTGSVDPATDIVWWVIPRADLQAPAAEALLTATSAQAAPAVGGIVSFNAPLADVTPEGRNFAFPGGGENDPPTVTLLASPTTGPTPLDVTFTITTDANAATSSWTLVFGDGDTASGAGLPPATLTHVYETPGAHVALLTVTDNGLPGTASATVTAAGPAGTYVEVQAVGLPPVVATCASDCATWAAELDLAELADGEVLVEARLIVDGAVTSTDTVTLDLARAPGLVVDAPIDQQRVPLGEELRVQGRMGRVDDRAPIADLAITPTQGVAPLDVVFDLDGADDKGVVSWRLTTGDGRVVDGTTLPAQVAHEYTSTGAFTVVFRVVDTKGQSSSSSGLVTVQAENAAPTAPSSPTPADGATNVVTPTVLGWSASDPDGNALTYDVYLDTGSASTQVASDLPTPTFSPSGLLGGTTYRWRVVASDGLAETPGPTWSFTTKAVTGGLASRPHAVVAFIDSGVNPYHEQFRRAEYTAHPSTYVSGYPAGAVEVRLCFVASTCPADPAAAPDQDAAQWGKLGVSPASATGAGAGSLGYFPGTNIVGAISFAHDGTTGFATLDGAKGGGDSHGTAVAGSIAGDTTGSCPECLLVVVEGDTVAAITAGYQWAANQPWIDVITSSVSISLGAPVLGALGPNPGDFFEATSAATRTAVQNGKLFFEAAGNGALNAGAAPTTTAWYANYNPWTISVGCSAPRSGQFCVYSDFPVPITATGIARQTTNVNSYTSVSGWGGTSFSSPSAAGVAGRTLLLVRTAMGDTGEGPVANATKSLVRPAGGATLPLTNGLANGVLTRLELEEALFKTARRDLVPQAPFYIFPTEGAHTPASFLKEGYGHVYRGDFGIRHPNAQATWSSAADAAAVLLGAKGLPNRWVEETWYEKVVDPTMVALFGADVADPDADTYPRNDDPQPGNLGGYSAATELVDGVPRASVVQAAPPSETKRVLYLHHATLAAGGYEKYLNTDVNPAALAGQGSCTAHPCDDRTGVGGVGPGPVTWSYTVAYPTPTGPILLSPGGVVTVRVTGGNYAGDAPGTPTSMTFDLYSKGVRVGGTSAVQQIATGSLVDAVYQASFVPSTTLLEAPIELRLSISDPAFAMYVDTRGKSWIDLPIVAQLPTISYAPVTYYVDDVHQAVATNPGSGTLTRNAAALTGDADTSWTFFLPQPSDLRVNLVANDALAAKASLLGGGGTARIWACTKPIHNTGAADVTVSVGLAVDGVGIGGGSATRRLVGQHSGNAVPFDIPLGLLPSLLPTGKALTATVSVTSALGTVPQTVGFCGGSAAKPWTIQLLVGELGTVAPTATVAVPAGPQDGVVTIAGTVAAPAERARGQVTWNVIDMQRFTNAQTTKLTLDVAAPGPRNTGPTFLPQPNGWLLTLESAAPVARDASALAPDGVARAQMWLSARGGTPEATVDFTVLLRGAAGDRTLGQGVVTKRIAMPLVTLPPSDTMPTELFALDFRPLVTDPRPDEKLVVILRVRDAGPAATTLLSCACGDAARPVFVSLPVASEAAPTGVAVDVTVGDLELPADVVGASWSVDVDTSLLGDGDHAVSATPRAVYGATTRTGAPATGTLTVERTVTNLAPTAFLTVAPAAGMRPLPVTATVSATDDATPLAAIAWTLAWGDGATTSGIGFSGPAPTHTYANAGAYTARLEVRDAQGALGAAEQTITVESPPPVEHVVVRLGDGDAIAATDDSVDGDWSSWHADVPVTASGLLELVVERRFGEDVLEEQRLLVRAMATGAPEVELFGPTSGATITLDDRLEGRISRYVGEEPSSPAPLGDVSSSSGVAEAFLAVADTVRPQRDARRVVATDLTEALARLLAADGRDPSRAAALEAQLELPLGAEKPLASIVMATALAVEEQKAATAGLTLDELRRAPQLSPLLDAAGADPSRLAPAAARVLATIDAELPALRGLAPVERAGDAPDLDEPGLVAIDTGGDTTYTGLYMLVIDLAGNDVRNDNAGGGVFNVAVSLDVAGDDVYEATILPDNAAAADTVAVQGAGDSFGIGLLVDAAGDDTYAVTNDMTGGTNGFFDRAAQGAATFISVGVLADLGGNDRYAYTGLGSPARTPDTLVFVAAQGAAQGGDGSVPGYGLLLDFAGDDRYVASETPVVGVFQANTTQDALGAPTLGAIVDLDGSDAYSRAPNKDFAVRRTVGGVQAASALHLDTDAQDPALHVRAPAALATVKGALALDAEARDLADTDATPNQPNTAFRALPRTVQWVNVTMGDVTVPLARVAGTTQWTGTFDTTAVPDGATSATFTATSSTGAITTRVVELVVRNNEPPTLAVAATVTRDVAPQAPAIALDFAGTSDPEGAPVTIVVDWGDGSAPQTVAGTTASHTYAPGAYALAVTATDPAGNAASRALGPYDLAAPGLAATVVSTSRTTATLSVTLTEDATLAVAPPLAVFATVTGTGLTRTVSFSGLAPLTDYAATLVATDAGGNEGRATASFRTGAGAAPVVTLVAPTVAAPGDAVVANVTVADPEGDLATLVVAWGDGATTTLAGVAGARDLSHTYAARCACVITATATDALGSTGSDTAGILVDAAPVVTLTLPAGRAPATSANALLVTVTDSDGDAVTATLKVDGFTQRLTAVDAADTDTTDGKTFRATGVYAPGLRNVTATASDGDRTGTASGSFRVNAPPTVTGGVSPGSGVVGASFTYDAVGHDADGDAVTVTLLVDTTSVAMSGTGLEFTHTRALGKGQHRYAFVASDGIDAVRFPGPAAFAFGPVVGNVLRVEASTTDDFAAPVLATLAPDLGTFSLDLAALALAEDETATVYVRAVDEDTGATAAQALDLTLDDKPTPTLTVLDTGRLTAEDIRFVASAEPSAHGDEVVAYAWSFGDGATATGAEVAHAFARPGRHAVTLTVRDAADRTAVATTTVDVLNRAPVATLASDREVLTPVDDVTFTLSATDADGTIVSRTLAAYAGESVEDGVLASGTSSLALRFPDDGRFLVVGTATDDSGATHEVELLVTVLNAAPVAALAATPNPVETLRQVRFDAGASGDADGSLVSYTYDLGDGTVVTLASSELLHAYEDDGVYETRVTVTDDDGATRSSATLLVTVLNTPPVAVLDAPAAVATGEAAAMSAAASSDRDGEIVAYLWEFGDGATSTDAETTHSYAARGAYTVRLTVTDDDGAATTATHLLTVGNAAPVLAPLPGRVAFEGETVTIEVEATDVEGDAVTLATGRLPAGASFVDRGDGTGVFTWRPGTFDAGDYELVFEARDAEAFDRETVALRIAEANLGPAFAPLSPVTVREGGRVAFLVSASDPEGDALTYSMLASGFGMGFDASRRAFEWRPAFDQAGVYNVTFQASDGVTTTRETVRITVLHVNRAPEALGATSGSFVANRTGTLGPVFADPDGDALAFAATGLPAGASLDATTGRLTWRPGVTQTGTHTFVVAVSDGEYDRTATVTLTVVANRAPTLAVTAPARVEVGALVTLAATAADPDGTQAVTVTWDFDDANGLGADATGASTPWRPTRLGETTLTVTARDADGMTTTRQVVVLVDDNLNLVVEALEERVTAASSTPARVTATWWNGTAAENATVTVDVFYHPNDLGPKRLLRTLTVAVGPDGVEEFVIPYDAGIANLRGRHTLEARVTMPTSFLGDVESATDSDQYTL